MPATKVTPASGDPGTVAGNPTGTFGTQPGGTPTTPAVGASPVTFTNATANLQMHFVTPTVSATTTITKRGVVLATAVTPAACQAPLCVMLAPGESYILTYSAGAPVVQVDTP